MRITKYEHACLVIENNGQNLIIDPGNISDDFIVPKNVVGVVLTHEHPDHIDPEKMKNILPDNPEAVVVSHAGIINTNNWPHTQVVAAGDTFELGPFNLKFYGGKHELIHKKLPIVDNLGVMINDTLYYPGDSYATPGVPVKVLAVPTSGPWLKIGDVVDFVLGVHPEMAFSTHDAHSSEKNKALVDFMLPRLVGDEGITYMRLSGPLEV